MVIKVGIVGGTGYTGVELLRLLAQHPEVELKAVTSRTEAGMPVSQMYPNLRGRVDLPFSEPTLRKFRLSVMWFFLLRPMVWP
jgi:N-acetyl-gamma-glutamyl-phosphate reductase